VHRFPICATKVFSFVQLKFFICTSKVVSMNETFYENKDSHLIFSFVQSEFDNYVWNDYNIMLHHNSFSLKAVTL